MKNLILGGCGFLGSHLARALTEHGQRVRIYDRPNVARPAILHGIEHVDWCYGDFLDHESVAEAIKGCDVIYHFISTTLPKSSNENPVYDVDSNVIGTIQLLEVAKRERVRKIIFSSSGGTVYGIPQRNPIDEDHPTDPIASYGITKLTVEKYLHLYHILHGLDYCVLRIANPYGPGQRVDASQGAATVFLNKALKAEPIEVWGDGSVVRDYVFIEDVTQAFLRAAAYTGDQRLFNIGSGRGLSVNELIEAIRRVVHRQVTVNYKAARPYDVPVNVLDIRRAKEVLDWAPTVEISQGLHKTAMWMRERT